MTVFHYSEHSRPRLDVSHLKTSAMDSRAPAWWGNLLLMLIESTSVVLLLAAYLYIRQNYEQWPPPRTDMHPPILQPFPNLPRATVDLAIVAVGCIPMYLTNFSARRHNRWRACLGLFFMLLVTGVCITLRFFEYKDLHFRWDDNAYASVMWWILTIHLTYLATAAGEFFIMGAYLVTHDIDEKHALDITLAGGFYYWVAGAWALIYAVTFLGPRYF